MNIPLFRQLKKIDDLNLSFAPFSNPKVLICDKPKQNRVASDMPRARKGVYILVDTQNKHVFVGYSGIKAKKANLFNDEFSSLSLQLLL